jgi:hypothetical protein
MHADKKLLRRITEAVEGSSGIFQLNQTQLTTRCASIWILVTLTPTSRLRLTLRPNVIKDCASTSVGVINEAAGTCYRGHFPAEPLLHVY